MSKWTKRPRRGAQRERRDVQVAELLAIVERAKTAPLSESEYAALKMAVDTLSFLSEEIAAKGASIDRLRRMLFGGRTEKTRHVVGDAASDEDAALADGAAGGGPDGGTGGESEKKSKAPGHGRNGAAVYSGATKHQVPHAALDRGAGCPDCREGKVYPLAEPAVLVRVRGMAPLGADVYELDRLRCNLCGEVFTAASPPGVGDEKYDETVAAMIGLLKYGAGLPFHRIEKLQDSLGIPLPASTQWEIVERAIRMLDAPYAELINHAAQGQVLHNDDTTATILELMKAQPEQELAGASADVDTRTGTFTTGIVAQCADQRVALFFTGRKHAGENLAAVLARRAVDLTAPIQMCDALSRNLPGDLATILANCLGHARRRFVDVVGDFPVECRHLLESLRDVYHHDALARERQLSLDERLAFHQAESGPIMDGLHAWLTDQIESHKVEPNSGLGEAIGYMLKHWSKLTLFLRVAGAPLDNNICERALKKAILHRKNALFYKTLNGAHVGDVFMSLIHTAELGGENPFDYLVALQRHADEVAASPGDWMPWNYRTALAALAGRGPPS
jgi:transposase